MADFSKYNAYSVGRLFLHNNRKANDGVYHSNEMIDDERTMFNYHIKYGTTADVQKRLNEVFVMKRKDTIVLGEMVVTLPKDVKPEDERNFFQAVYDFYANDFGENNIMNAVVHKDETTPHIHIDFVPVLKGEPNFTGTRGKFLERWKEENGGKMPTERICCKDLITRKYLSQMHPRLSKFVKENIGYEVEIMNGATMKGNKTVLELKVETLQKEIEQLNKQRNSLSSEISEILTMAKKNGIEKSDIGLYPLIQKVEDLENQNGVLKNIITRQGYSWKKEDIEAIKEKKYSSAKSVKVNVYNTSLNDAEIDKNAVIIIELPDQKSRPSPQKELMEKDADLERQAKFVQSSTRQIMVRKARTSDKVYLFFKTDSEKQTMENLLLLEEHLREIDLTNRRVFMQKIETDTYDLARSILEKSEIETSYYINNLSADKEKRLEINKEK